MISSEFPPLGNPVPTDNFDTETGSEHPSILMQEITNQMFNMNIEERKDNQFIELKSIRQITDIDGNFTTSTTDSTNALHGLFITLNLTF